MEPDDVTTVQVVKVLMFCVGPLVAAVSLAIAVGHWVEVLALFGIWAIVLRLALL